MDPRSFFANSDNGSATPPADSGETPVQAHGTEPQPTADVPGQGQDQQPGGPPQQDQPPVDSQQQPTEDQSSQQQAAQAAENERLRQLERENQELRGTFSQIENWAQQQAQTQREQQIQQYYSQRLAQAQQTADNMSHREGLQYLASEQHKINNELLQAMRQEQQQREQQHRQQLEAIAVPQYVRKLVQDAGLPPEAEQELMALGDPNAMQRYVPIVQKRHQEQQQLRQQLDQMARSQQANSMTQQGAGVAGGQIAPQGTPNLDDMEPDEKARHLYNQIMNQAYGAGR